MKRWLLPLIIVLLVGWAVYDFALSDRTKVSEEMQSTTGDEADPLDGIDLDELAPGFSLQNLEDDSVTLNDLRGEPVLINFWATWCPPCKAEMPDMQKFYEETGMAVLAVNVTNTERSRDNVPKFIDEFELTFPVLLDEEGLVSTEYGAHQLPTSYFLDSEGKVHLKLAGPMTYDFMMDQYEQLQNK